MAVHVKDLLDLFSNELGDLIQALVEQYRLPEREALRLWQLPGHRILELHQSDHAQLGAPTRRQHLRGGLPGAGGIGRARLVDRQPGNDDHHDTGTNDAADELV